MQKTHSTTSQPAHFTHLFEPHADSSPQPGSRQGMARFASALEYARRQNGQSTKPGRMGAPQVAQSLMERTSYGSHHVLATGFEGCDKRAMQTPHDQPASPGQPSTGASTITPDTVRHVAKLARLALREEDIPRLTADFSAIVGYFDLLSEIGTDDVEETAGVSVKAMPLRADEPRPSLPREAVLAGAARSFDEGFAVPGFVDE